MPRDFDIERCLWRAYGTERRRPSTRSSKTGRLVRVGPTPLPGIDSGVLAIELGPNNDLEHSRLWVCSEDHWQPEGLNGLLVRICHQPPASSHCVHALNWWIDPDDSFAQVSGLGAEWLLPAGEATPSGLVPARLNTLMLDLEAISALGLVIQ